MKKRISPAGNNPLRAFTLLEILVVLTIIGVMVAIAVPAYAKISSYLKISSASNQLWNDLRVAHKQAVAENRIVEIDFQPAQSAYSIDGIKHRLATSIAIKPDSNQPILHFYSDGSANPMAITLSYEKRRTTLAVDWLTGQVKFDANS